MFPGMKEILFNGGVIKDQRTKTRSRGVDLVAMFDAPYNILVADVEQKDKSFKATPIRMVMTDEDIENIVHDVELIMRFGLEDGKEYRNFRLGTVSAKRAREWKMVPGYSVINISDYQNPSLTSIPRLEE